MALVTVPEIQTLDPYFGNVVLLLSGNGANGSTVFTDNSFSKRAVTPVGNAQIITTQSMFGGSSMYFDGAGDYLTLPSVTDVLGGGDFCIESRVYPPSLPTSGVRTIYHWLNVNGVNGINLELRTDGAIGLYLFGVVPQHLTGGTVPINQWSHVALCRYGNALLVFVNGVLSITLITAVVFLPAVLEIGYDSTTPARGWLGYMDELRITKGVARYTGDFTPPTAEFPWLDVSALGARAFNTNVSRRICAPPRAMAPGGAVTTAFDNKLAQRNSYFGGTGQITGTVKEKSLPANVPLHRRVCLLEEKTRLLVAETWSDATAGNYVFERIDPTRTYTVMAYDHTGLYRAVIADNIIPTQP